MGFNEYINELLFEHNCVIVPGFGGLVAHTEKARINTITHQIFPPCKTIAFNQKLDHNDGLLASYLVRKTGVTYDEAITAIGKFSEDAKRELKTNNSFSIPSVGNFYLNKENSIQFTPAEDANFLYGSFGLLPITLPGVPANQEAILKGIERKPARYRKIQWLAGTAAAILILAACIFSFRTELFKMNHNIVTLNPFDTLLGASDVTDSPKAVTETETVTGTDTETVKDTLANVTAVDDKAAFVENNTLPAMEPVRSAERKFYIIGGAFHSSFNANRYRAMLEKKGYDASLAGKNKSGLIRVSYESFSDSLQAAGRLEIIKSNENQQAWILAQ